MKSAKSPIESLSTRASRAWGAFGRSFAPALALEEIGAGLYDGTCLGNFGDFGDLGDLWAASLGGFERRADNLVTDDECDRPVSGLGPVWVAAIIGAACRGLSGDCIAP